MYAKRNLLSVVYRNNLIAVQKTKQCSAVVKSWKEPLNISLTAAKNAFVGWALNFRVRLQL